MNFKNLIFAKHTDSEQQYLFELPLSVKLYELRGIYVNTARGTARAVTSTESFIVSEDMANLIAKGCGAYLPLKRVLGTVVLKEHCKEFEQTDFLPF